MRRFISIYSRIIGRIACWRLERNKRSMVEYVGLVFIRVVLAAELVQDSRGAAGAEGALAGVIPTRGLRRISSSSSRVFTFQGRFDHLLVLLSHSQMMGTSWPVGFAILQAVGQQAGFLV